MAPAFRLVPALALLGWLAWAAVARAGEPYAPLVRDLDRLGLLEQVIERTVATQWGAVRVIVPSAQRARLVDPLVEAARKSLGRAETKDVIDDLLSLHEAGVVGPQLAALLAALDHGGQTAENLAALAKLAPLAEAVGIDDLAALGEEFFARLDAAPLAAIAAEALALPEPTWRALDRVAAEALEAGAAERLALFLRAGPEPGRGLEPVRAGLPMARCLLEPARLGALSGGADFIFSFVDSHPEPSLLVSLAQWSLAQLDDAQSRHFLSASLAYERLPQLAAAHRSAIAEGVLQEVVLDYADFLAGTDKRVRVEPELWKHLSREKAGPPGQGGLGGVDLIKLGALTLYTVHRLDEIASAPRSDGRPQSLADELLDYADYQLLAQDKKSMFSPLFDVVREFLTPTPERELLVAVARQFAAHLTRNDPAPLLAAVDALLACDPPLAGARGMAALLDEDPSNGDGRILTPLGRPFSLTSAEPLVPLLGAASRLRRPGRALAPAALAVLNAESDRRLLSRLALGIAADSPPLLVRLDPLLRGLAQQGPVWRGGLAQASQERIARSLTWARASLARSGRDGKTRSDASRLLGALAAWAGLRSPLSGRSLLAEAGLVGTESLRSGLADLLLDAALALRNDDPKKGVQRLIEALRAALDPGRQASASHPPSR